VYTQIALGLEGYVAQSLGIVQQGNIFIVLSCIVRTLLVT
jgi:hypothetical protein